MVENFIFSLGTRKYDRKLDICMFTICIHSQKTPRPFPDNHKFLCLYCSY